jgi:hypothetical protein
VHAVVYRRIAEVRSYTQVHTLDVNTAAMQPSPLANPLATVQQLEESGSRLDGIPAHLETSIRFTGARFTQAAGILLRLPQEVIAQAIVVYMRFWLGAEGGSLAEFGALVSSPTCKSS